MRKRLFLPWQMQKKMQQPVQSTHLGDQIWLNKARKLWTKEEFVRLVEINDAKTLYTILLNDLKNSIGTPLWFMIPAIAKIAKDRNSSADAVFKELVDENQAATGNKLL